MSAQSVGKSGFMTSADIHARVDWPTLLTKLGIASNFLTGRHGPCPHCGGKDRFRFDNKFSRGDYICNQCGSGDGFRLVQVVRGCDFLTSRALVMEGAGLSGSAAMTKPAAQPIVQPAVAAQYCTLSDYGRAIWGSCLEIDGEAAAYLSARRCQLPPRDGDLRWHPNLRHPSGYEGPALVGLVTDAVTNEALSVHRTWIHSDGNKAPVSPPRMLLKGHKKSGGVLRLWPNEAVTSGLSIAEGIETCLAAAHAFQPIWSTIDAGNMEAFRTLSGVSSLVIFADHDDAGLRAANSCAQRWAKVASVTVVHADEPGFDIADVVAA